MKKLAAILAMVCVLAISGCGGNTSSSSNTTTSGKSGGTVTAVAMEAPEREDTTAQALEFLAGKAPLFYNYLTIRRSIPLCFESTVTNESGTWHTGIYIKDEHTAVQYSEDPDGNVTKVFYLGDTSYQTDSSKKYIYEAEGDEDKVKGVVDNLRLAVMYYDDVSSANYSTDTAFFEDTEYDRVAIINQGVTTSHYFDKATGELRYSVTGDVVTKIERLSNEMPDDSVFVLPDDYTPKTVDDLLNDYLQSASENG